jgi:hypothetical protein
VAGDASLKTGTSMMRHDYPPYKNVPVPAPIDNTLQRSHIRIQGNGAAWTTTQQDYFLWDRYKMPGSPY